MAFYTFSISSLLVALVALQQPSLLFPLEGLALEAICHEAYTRDDAEERPVCLQQLQAYLKSNSSENKNSDWDIPNTESSFEYIARTKGIDRSTEHFTQFRQSDVALGLSQIAIHSNTTFLPNPDTGFTLPLRI